MPRRNPSLPEAASLQASSETSRRNSSLSRAGSSSKRRRYPFLPAGIFHASRTRFSSCKAVPGAVLKKVQTQLPFQEKLHFQKVFCGRRRRIFPLLRKTPPSVLSNYRLSFFLFPAVGSMIELKTYPLTASFSRGKLFFPRIRVPFPIPVLY